METDGDSAGFDHSHARAEDRLLVKSTCKRCGMFKLVSVHDGSLEKWESSHKCENVVSTRL